MNFLSNYGKEIVSLLVPFITWLLNVGIKAKPKLIWSRPHFFDMLVQEPLHDEHGVLITPTQIVRTASLQVLNIGRDTATKVELVINWKPKYFNVVPPRHYEVKTDPDSRYILIFDNLSPKEDIRVEIMAINANLPEVIQVRSAECTARRVDMISLPEVPRWRIKLFVVLMFTGSATMVYLIIALIQALVLNTPS